MWNDYSNLVIQIQDLRREATETFERLVSPEHATHSFNQTLYGYVHRVFSFIDALSSYWCGTDKNEQLPRMVHFMETYIGPHRRAHSIAVQIWRHKLVHTALPRILLDPVTGHKITYMIQWHKSQLTTAQPHYTITAFGEDEVFNISCISLIEDLATGADRFVAELQGSCLLQANAAKYAGELARYRLRQT